EIAALYRGHRLTALTDQTPSTLDALHAAVERAAAQGYVISHGSMESGGISISAPVVDASGALVAAIDISCPESAFGKAALGTPYKPALLHAADEISKRLAPR